MKDKLDAVEFWNQKVSVQGQRKYPLIKGYPVGKNIQIWCFFCNKYHYHELTPWLLKGRKMKVDGRYGCPMGTHYIQLATRAHIADVHTFMEYLVRCKKTGKKPGVWRR